MRPLKFIPFLKSVLWGGERIAAFKHLHTQQHQIGESWEISAVKGHESIVADGPDAGMTLPELIARDREALMGQAVTARFGNEFPLLIKFIDARDDLSVQVHPDDELAARRHGCPGKTEMWYVIDTEPDAAIMAGFSRPINAETYDRLIEQGNIMDVVTRHVSHPGDVFFLPAGTIHSIGAGNLLAEIQQTSDITYRVHDYGRRDAMGNLRPLHTQLAREAIDYNAKNDYLRHYDHNHHGWLDLVNCSHFVVSRIVVDGTLQLPWEPMHSFLVVMAIDGSAHIITDGYSTDVKRGESILIPACVAPLTIAGKGTLLTARMP